MGMRQVNYREGDYISFWLWAHRNRGRVISHGWERGIGDYMVTVLRVSVYDTMIRKWEDLATPHTVMIPQKRILSKLRAHSAVIYKLRGN